MWIKVCGNTNLEDALLAAESGADAVGFVFAPSPRRVTVEQVAAITPALPFQVKKIGVFGDHSVDEIVFTVRAAGLNGAQLHGGSNLHRVEKLRKEFGGELFLIQTLHWPLDGDSDEVEEEFRSRWRATVRHNCVDAVLLDSKTVTASGGTGRSFNWARSRAVLDEVGGGLDGPLDSSGDGSGRGSLKVIVAGGLHAGNVAAAVRALRPWGVDVASGTESAPGKKDPRRIRDFIAAVRAAE